MIQLDLVDTLACAGVVLFAGYAIRGGCRLFARHSIPAPVVGGLLAALAVDGAARRPATSWCASTRRCRRP